MTKKITKVLPIGVAVFPKLNQVDVYQPVDKKGRPSGAEKRRFITNIKFEPEDHREVDAWLKECAEQAGVEDGKLPWKKSKKDGEITLVATSGEKYPPLLVDAKNRKLPKDVVIGGGSKIRVSVTVNAYEGFGGGVNLYLNAVQVIDLKESAFGKSPFEESEGYAAPEGSADKDEQEFDPSNEDMDDDIPF
jgi:hypothetical protein